MKPAVPWSVKGVEPDARETAKQAARGAGMTLGAWLSQKILESGAPDVGAGDGRTSDPAAGSGPDKRMDAEPMPQGRYSHYKRAGQTPPPPPETAPPSSPSAHAPAADMSNVGNSLDALRRHLQDNDARTERTFGQISRALEAVLNKLEDAGEGHQRSAQVTGETTDSVRAINAALTDVNLRLAAVERRPDMAADVAGLERTVKDVTRQLDTTTSRQEMRIDRVEHSFEHLSDRVEQRDGRRMEAVKGLERAVTELAGQLDSQTRDLSTTIENRAEGLTREMERRSAGQADVLRNTEKQIATLRHEQETRERDLSTNVENLRSRMTKLGDQFEVLRNAFADTLTHDDVRTIEERVAAAAKEAAGDEIRNVHQEMRHELLTRIEESESRSADAIAKMSRNVEAVRDAVQDSPDLSGLQDGLTQSLEEIMTRLEQLNTDVEARFETLAEETQDKIATLRNDVEPLLTRGPENTRNLRNIVETDPALDDDDDGDEQSLPPATPLTGRTKATPRQAPETDPTAEARPIPARARQTPQPDAPEAKKAEPLQARPLPSKPERPTRTKAKVATKAADAGSEGSRPRFIVWAFLFLCIAVGLTVIGTRIASNGSNDTIEGFREPPALPPVGESTLDSSPPAQTSVAQPGRQPEGATSEASAPGRTERPTLEDRPIPTNVDAVSERGQPATSASTSEPEAETETAARPPQTATPERGTGEPDTASPAASTRTSEPAVETSTSVTPSAAPEVDPELLTLFVEANNLLGQNTSEGDLAGARRLRTAANGDLAIAQYQLASLHEEGRGVPQDYALARRWYQRSAEAGNVQAMHNLAVLYAEGRVTDGPEYGEAARWFAEAARYGVRDSQFNLAVLFQNGVGVREDREQAYLWFAVAATSGDEIAAQARDQLAPQISADVRREIDQAALNWTPRPLDNIANGNFEGSGIFGLTQNEIARVQTLLARLGLEPGPADGVMGPRTADAIRQFERQAGLEETGRVTATLLSRLEAAASSN